MTTARSAAIALVVLALAGCAGGLGTRDGASPTEIARWSEAVGIAPELVYVTEIDGFTLNTQSVGVMGDDGMSAIYVRQDGEALSIVALTTSREAGPDDVPCADLPDAPEPAPALRCVVDRGDASIALDGEGVAAATLRAAAEAVRVPPQNDLDQLFSDVPVPEEPVERGDLPPEGDGAPINDVGVGG